MTDGFYYWTYRSHPHSNEDFLYDGILPYVPNSHIAHQMSRDLIGELAHQNQAVKHDLGIHLITPTNKLIRDTYDVEDVQDMSFDEIDREQLKQKAREQITDEDIIDVANRQEDMERHEMGEDVDSVIDVNKE